MNISLNTFLYAPLLLALLAAIVIQDWASHKAWVTAYKNTEDSSQCKHAFLIWGGLFFLGTTLVATTSLGEQIWSRMLLVWFFFSWLFTTLPASVHSERFLVKDSPLALAVNILMAYLLALLIGWLNPTVLAPGIIFTIACMLGLVAGGISWLTVICVMVSNSTKVAPTLLFALSSTYALLIAAGFFAV